MIVIEAQHLVTISLVPVGRVVDLEEVLKPSPQLLGCTELMVGSVVGLDRD